MTDFCVCKQIGSDRIKRTITVIIEIASHLAIISALLVSISAISSIIRHSLGEDYIFFKDYNKFINEIINLQFSGVHFSGIPLVVMIDAADFSLLIFFLIFGIIDCMNAYNS